MSFVGTGGVGKTTLSIVAAVQAAMLGRKVAAITVDPSKRLSRALGLSSKESEKQNLNWPELKGNLDVFVLDTEKTFHKFVEEALPPGYKEKIDNNRIFKQISKNLRETHNFTAVYKLYEIFESNEYDLIILDTPPSQQAIDFFRSPEKLKKFFTSEGLLKFKKSGWISWFGEKSMQFVYGAIGRLAGEEFLDEMKIFFDHVGELRTKIDKVTQVLLTEMKRPECHFVLVTSPAKNKLQESEFLFRQIGDQGFQIGTCIINQAYNWWLDLSGADQAIADPEAQRLYNYFKEQKELSVQIAHGLSKEKGIGIGHIVLVPRLPVFAASKDEVYSILEVVNQKWLEG